MGIRIEGFGELTRDLLDMAEKAGGKAADKALKAGAKPIYEDMKRQAEIDPKIRTGNLHKSIKVGRVGKTTRKGDYKTTKKISIGAYERNTKEMGAYAPHAHLVEYGHGGPAPAPPHPFVGPAYDKHVNEAYTEIRRVLEEALELKR